MSDGICERCLTLVNSLSAERADAMIPPDGCEPAGTWDGEPVCSWHLTQLSAGPPSLAAWLEWLGTPDCTCEHRWQGMGVLYGVSLGDGWVRLSDRAGCPEHGKG